MGNHWHPNGAGVSIDTQDGHLDLADVTWQHIAPCGCVCGVMMAAVAEELIITADQAMHQSAGSKAQYDRDVEQGFSCRPREHKAAVEELRTRCEHVPTWGVTPPPKPAGYSWAAVYALGSSPRFTHLVTDAAIEAAAEHRYSYGQTKPLCGGKAQYHWHTEPHATQDKPECKRCIAAGTALIEAAREQASVEVSA